MEGNGIPESDVEGKIEEDQAKMGRKHADDGTKKKRLLILSIFPAPYRVAVFRELAKHYKIDLFFEVVQNQDRNAGWFVESNAFRVLNTPENKQVYRQCLKNLKGYDMVLVIDKRPVTVNGIRNPCSHTAKHQQIGLLAEIIIDQHHLTCHSLKQ